MSAKGGRKGKEKVFGPGTAPVPDYVKNRKQAKRREQPEKRTVGSGAAFAGILCVLLALAALAYVCFA